MSNQNATNKDCTKTIHSRYYGSLDVQIKLYNMSKENKRFNNLTNYVFNENNIKYALKRIMDNPGGNTPGPDGLKLKDILEKDFDEVLKLVRSELDRTSERYIRRTYIPKGDNKFKPLGIANIIERIAQQAVLNILECITEAKFSNRSYGFRKNLTTMNAIAKICNRIVNAKNFYIVNTDFKSYFDNVPLEGVINKLRNNYNIQDRKFLKLIKRLMWCNIIDGKEVIKYNGIGLAQGSILGPTLANVILDELDKEIESYSSKLTINNKIYGGKLLGEKKYGQYHNWRNGRIDAFNVRYADDLIVITPTEKEAVEIQTIIEKWSEKNNIPINKEKSSIINSNDETKIEYLGYRINKTKNGLYISVKDQHKTWKKCRDKFKHAMKINDPYLLATTAAGYINYYSICSNIQWLIEGMNQLIYKDAYKKHRYPLVADRITYDEGNNRYILNPKNQHMELDLWSLRKATKQSYSRFVKCNYWDPNHIDKDNYTNIYVWCDEVINARKGNKENKSRLDMYIHGLSKIKKNDPIMNIPLVDLYPGEVEIHHIKPRNLGGKDEFNNLIILHKKSHMLIHHPNPKDLEGINIKQLNKYRKKAGMNEI